jgi:hypothetical protein
MRLSLQILLFITIGGLFIQSAQAQIKCKFDYEEDDPFTGKLSRGTSATIFPTSISTREYWEIGFERVNDNYSVTNDISIAGKSDEYLYQGDSLMFATKDGSIISCYASERVSPVTRAERVMSHDLITTNYISTYTISRRQMEMLARSAVTSIRINIGEEVFMQEIKSRHAKDIMQDANCILQ